VDLLHLVIRNVAVIRGAFIVPKDKKYTIVRLCHRHSCGNRGQPPGILWGQTWFRLPSPEKQKLGLDGSENV